MNKDRWEALMRALEFNASFDCYDALYAAYSEKHRSYHTVKHIEAMLAHFDAVKDLAERPAELELARNVSTPSRWKGLASVPTISTATFMPVPIIAPI